MGLLPKKTVEQHLQALDEPARSAALQHLEETADQEQKEIRRKSLVEYQHEALMIGFYWGPQDSQEYADWYTLWSKLKKENK